MRLTRFSIRGMLAFVLVLAVSIVAWNAYIETYPPTQIKLLGTLNRIDHEELLYFNGEHPDPMFAFSDKQHIIAGGIELLAEAGHPVRWHTHAGQFVFASTRSRWSISHDSEIHEMLDKLEL